jgi:hypothetical protein
MALANIIDMKAFPLGDPAFRARCRADLDRDGVLVMPGFLVPDAVETVRREGVAHRDQAYFCAQDHTAYLSPQDPAFAPDHARNRLVKSTKGCITDDIVPAESPLRTLYNAGLFRDFLCDILGEEALYDYADPLSSINIHYAETGQELGWHFDNSSFAITLMIQPAEQGGQFEYVTGVRDADAGDMNYDGVGAVLDGKAAARQLTMESGALVLFRGRNAIHRVTPNDGARTRMLVVLAYNAQPGISLSEAARMTFYGRTG